MRFLRVQRPLLFILWATTPRLCCGLSTTLHKVRHQVDTPYPGLSKRGEVIPGSIGDDDANKEYYESGRSSVNISQGGIIAIAVIVGIVVVLGITSVILFYLAKRRQWEVRASIRRSARRLTAPLTPRRFSSAPSAISRKTRNREISMRAPVEVKSSKQQNAKDSSKPSKSSAPKDKHASLRGSTQPLGADVEKGVEPQYPIGKSEFEPASPRGWRKFISRHT
ncbi:hypothetical protein PAAG_01239 [Paracoccidioides lutzii Pb01]|uniref:Uncharacterized protein n=1 Tax=Paracoccidioides lutzii (strain ATCC MYA-826 / Pb01) TaxID=502779 RepID=C1GRU4_PARBA|nr:hypothetical protein PAAG_01239 [Paracoccidioides lutzii Pb01]EEH38318.1 hypothetical protein PAAG_01239 [Paracoccidioides lutzii Pb01]